MHTPPPRDDRGGVQLWECIPLRQRLGKISWNHRVDSLDMIGPPSRFSKRNLQSFHAHPPGWREQVIHDAACAQRPWHLKRKPSSARLIPFSQIGFARSNVQMYQYVPVRAVSNFVLPWMSRKNFADLQLNSTGWGHLGVHSAQMKSVTNNTPHSTFSFLCYRLVQWCSLLMTLDTWSHRL